jgi:DNA replication protein DnaD
MDLLLEANHKPVRVNVGSELIAVNRGQVLTSQVKLAQRWKWHRETVVKRLGLFKTSEMIDFKTSNRTSTGYTLITIRNYGKYQNPADEQTDTRTDSSLSDSAENIDIETSNRTSNEKANETIGFLGGSSANGLAHPTVKPAAKPAANRQSTGTNNNEKNEKKRRRKHESTLYLEGFSDFYNAYPRHEHRSDAENAWSELRPDDVLRATIISAAAAYRTACKFRRTDQGFIKLPATWLRAKCWTDEYESVKPHNFEEGAFPSV